MKPINQTGFSLHHGVNTNVSVALNATNAFGVSLHRYWCEGSMRLHGIRDQDRSIGKGARFKF